MIYSNEIQGDLMRPFLMEFLQFLSCNLRYKCPKLTGLGKTHRKRIFVVELKLKLPKKVPSISSTVSKYLTF